MFDAPTMVGRGMIAGKLREENDARGARIGLVRLSNGALMHHSEFLGRWVRWDWSNWLVLAN